MKQGRQSIASTYDHRLTGDRFTVETLLQNRRIDLVSIRDPFIHTRITIGWRDLLRGLLQRKVVVTVIVGGDPEIVEDVTELDNDYTGQYGSTRRAEWRNQIEEALLKHAERDEV